MINLDLWVDGAYSNEDVRGAYVIIKNDKPLLGQKFLFKDPVYKKSRNVSGELMAAARGVLGVIAILRDANLAKEEVCLTINYDYEGIAKFLDGSWRATKKVPIRYVGVMRYIMDMYPNITLEYNKVKGHSGIFWNDVVDAYVSKSVIPNIIKEVAKEEEEVND